MRTVNEKVRIVHANPKWPQYYEEEAAILRKLLSRRVTSIDHFGSTSVPGLSAKPIIDILIGVKILKLPMDSRKRLSEIGYEYIGRTRARDRIYLRKRGKRNFNLAVVVFGEELWTHSILFRDYLRLNPKAAAAYARRKQEIVEAGVDRLFEYTDEKAVFVERLIRRAQARP